MAFIVIGNLLAECLHKKRPFRPRPDKTHVATDYVNELRQLVQAVLAEDLPDARDARIGFNGPLGAIGFGFAGHGAELEDLETSATPTHALLAVNDCAL